MFITLKCSNFYVNIVCVSGVCFVLGRGGAFSLVEKKEVQLLSVSTSVQLSSSSNSYFANNRRKKNTLKNSYAG